MSSGNLPRPVQTIPLSQIHKAVGIKWTTTEELLPEYWHTGAGWRHNKGHTMPWLALIIYYLTPNREHFLSMFMEWHLSHDHWKLIFNSLSIHVPVNIEVNFNLHTVWKKCSTNFFYVTVCTCTVSMGLQILCMHHLNVSIWE